MRYLLAPVLAVVSATPLLGAPTTQSPEPLPDLGVAPIRHLLVGLTAERKKEFRFTVSIANVGRGPMEVVASRPSLGAEWTTRQRIRRADGTSHREPTPGARMVFVGSPEHGHWHIRGMARYELRPLGATKPVRIHVKRGFCLYDSSDYRRSLRGAPGEQQYERSDCGEKRALSVAMGISVGWKDDYFWRISGQILDVTSVPLGKYRLTVKVDPRNWFRESNERNNVTWVDIVIGQRDVRVLRQSTRV